ncbi:MAG: YaiO family outer membrane beta-barrel protein [Gemmatimonadaceae bacterium]|nr:YaiO family outer membrane beta-barrel protein [Gemmatimonadaceae bacterium]
MSRTLRTLLLAALFLCSAESLAAQDPWRHVMTVELRAGRDALSNGAAAWQDQGASLRYSASTRAGLGVGAEQLQRFGREDRRATAELFIPLGRRVTVGVEGEASDTHVMVPRQGGAAQLNLALPAGWGLTARGALRRYDDNDVRGGSAGIEKYLGNAMLSYSATAMQLARLDPVVTHSARYAYFFGDRGSFTVQGSVGTEVEALMATGPLVVPVRGVGAWGVIPVAPHLALTWASDVSRHAGFFTRKRAQVGVRVVSR